MIVIPDTSKAHWLKYVLGNEEPDFDVTYHWYTNNFTPDDDTVVGDFTEAGSGLIGTLTVPNSEWTYSLAAHVETATGTAHVLGVTSPVTLYGYWVTRQDDATVLLWCERFPAGPFIYAANGTLTFTPRVTFFTCNQNVQYVYSSPGYYPINVPADATKLSARAWGSGGGGGISVSEFSGGGGGGGGAFASIIDYPVTPGTGVELQVPSGLSGEANGASATVTVVGVLACEAVGGHGGAAGLRGAGGLASACTGDLAYDGGDGADADSSGSGGGGASGGTLGSGGDGLGPSFGGAGGAPQGEGGAGGGGAGLMGTGGAGFVPGGGGGGNGTGAEGSSAGGNGRIVLIWS